MANTKKKVKRTKKKDIEEEIIREEKTEEELRNEFFDAKEDKDSVLMKVMSIILWIVLFVWIAMCLIDFYKTRTKKEPMFTFKHEIVEYEDGEVESHLGLGYKIYNYKRKCLNGIEFGPFWTKDRSLEDENCNK